MMLLQKSLLTMPFNVCLILQPTKQNQINFTAAMKSSPLVSNTYKSELEWPGIWQLDMQ
jgi:hypothetical protein